MRIGSAILLLALGAASAFAQEQQGGSVPVNPGNTLVEIPPGTHVLLRLRSAVSTSTAREGDGVYLEAAFPVAADGRIVVPEGTAFEGRIVSAKRSGRMRGRATLQVRIERMIYASGYVVAFQSAVQSTPGSEGQSVTDDRGTIRADSTRGKDALLATGAALAGGYAGTATGALVGTLADRSPRVGGAVGGGTGAALGLIAVLAMRGKEIRLEPGDMTEIVLQAPVTIDVAKIGDAVPVRHEAVRRVRQDRERAVRPRLPIPWPRL
ncbi:MAG TPA: hypothetical protein VF135_04515 [Terriglobales bacterium]